MLNETVFIQRFLKGIDRNWLSLLQGKPITPEEAVELTCHFDIDKGSYDYSTMIARIGMMNDYQNFRPDLVPRLKGLISYQKTRRALNHAAYRKLMDELERNHTQYTAGYYLSLDAKYCQNDWRAKYVFDVIVHPEEKEKVQQLTTNDEKTFKTVILPEEESFIWQDRIEVPYCSRQIRVLSPDAMVMEYAERVCQSLPAVLFRPKGKEFEKLRWLLDYKLIDSQNGGIDPAMLAQYCTGRDIRVYHTVRFLMSCAYTYYEEKEKLQKLQFVMPMEKTYLSFLKHPGFFDIFR